MGIELMELMKNVNPAKTVAVEGAFTEVRNKLNLLIDNIKPGNFVEITRVGKNRHYSVVAQKFLEDREEFRDRMRLFLDDECEVLEPGQWIEINVTRK